MVGADWFGSHSGDVVLVPDAGDVLQLSRVGHVVAGLVLGQDLHQRTEFQPPLFLRDPVTGRVKKTHTE